MTPDDPRLSSLEAPPDTEIEMDRDTEATPKGGSPSELASGKERRPPPAETNAPGVRLRGLDAFYGDSHAIKGVDLDYEPNQVTAMIGPSGCGKSTLVRCINRMHEEIPGARAEGQILLDDLDINGDVDVVAVRRAIGMVFQKPNPFPTMSIFENVAAGLKLAGVKGVDMRERVERSLVGAGLWEEVKDRLDQPGVSLSGGQQQRLCIARTIAVEPDVILMDEPCSALDPIATLKIEDLIQDLKQRYTIVIVTHNMQQAARVADTTAFMLLGELVEHAPTEKIFSNPGDCRTEEYVTGKFG
jgi:phosphate transport system ATP-binding protein